ncbi:reactive intermediate/imine deaminase [Saccharopolyspora lacisalsi]|uniref:Reactive intermediate/imine deaminase n=1 Tax=Halosaccharopolyspora lacisalsi TaxID=1000566 RepID=A0A839E560_9PSEU|nr:Rid family detoxifying hydrolase [Halosaccharopolyspora lacisalsi]MBA8826038.1 reactive intermediate/imine deaminase [Halosaccharopolyspora lacisalsi]
MTRTVISTGDAPAPAAGVPLSQAVRKGNILQVSGQTPVNPETGKLAEGGVVEQTEQSLRNVIAILEAGGASLRDVLMLRVYLTDVAHFTEMNETYARVVGEPFPARTTVYVGLPGEMLVEIDALAVVD